MAVNKTEKGPADCKIVMLQQTAGTGGETTDSITKKDLIVLGILELAALGIGAYLIVTTVLIAKDGISYIQQAQQFLSDPIGAVGSYPPCGYSLLIFLVHKAVGLFGVGSSLYTWIYSAQITALLCRLLALIPLYFIGRFFVGGRRSFWAIFILVMLPYPAQFGSDVLREWPHILFLASGFLFLVLGARQGRWWMFAVAGLVAGFGYIIRPECIQLVIYGLLWLLTGFFGPRRNMSRSRLVSALLALLICFAVPVTPYMKIKGKILPEKLQELVEPSGQDISERIQRPDVDGQNGMYYAAVSVPGDIVKGIGNFIQGISEHLMFFLPALPIGIYRHFRRRPAVAEIERFFVFSFIVFNVIILILLYCNYGYISKRHCLPFVALLIFYVPVGLDVLGDWPAARFSGRRSGTESTRRLWFFVLLATGIIICVPKLIKPMRIEKKGYRTAVEWLKANTTKEELIAVPDFRIGFYAERPAVMVSGDEIAHQVRYVVRIIDDTDKQAVLPEGLNEVYSVPVNGRDKERRVVIYKAM